MGKGLGSLITKTVATGFKMEKKAHTLVSLNPAINNYQRKKTHMQPEERHLKKNLKPQTFHIQHYPSGLNLCEYQIRSFLEAGLTEG